jgi:multidrug efflux pump subunit AcrA (membrane-fusion protein)
MIAGMVMSAMSSYQQSKAQQASMDYQAEVAHNNAISAEYQAQDAIKRGEVAEADQRRRTAMMKGSQTARLAANGLDISEGSALNILSDTDWMGEQDALTVRDNASREAWAYRQQGANSQSNSNMLSASADAQNPLFSGATSIMTNPALGTVASKWYNMSGNSGSGNASPGIKIPSDPWNR